MTGRGEAVEVGLLAVEVGAPVLLHAKRAVHVLFCCRLFFIFSNGRARIKLGARHPSTCVNVDSVVCRTQRCCRGAGSASAG